MYRCSVEVVYINYIYTLNDTTNGGQSDPNWHCLQIAFSGKQIQNNRVGDMVFRNLPFTLQESLKIL